MADTAQLALPLLAPAQAQKHVTVNEALRMLDALVQARVESAALSVPPAEPGEGQAWIVAGPGAVNAWEGWEGDVAVWADGGWTRLAARAGWRVWNTATATVLVRVGAAWVSLADVLGVVGVAALGDGSLPRLGVGAAADGTNGLVFRGTNALFQSDTGIDATLNKAAPGQDASLTFKTAYSARALLGLLGSDTLQLKVSPNGSAFHVALEAEGAGGAISTPGGLRLPDGTAAAPGLAFAADADTGLRRPASDQIGLVTGGTQRALLSNTALQVSVPVTGTAVVSGTTDTTAGRLLTPGWMGLGTDALQNNADWDAITATGFYRNTNTSPTGLPSAHVNWHMVHINNSATNAIQLALNGTSAATGDLRFRRKNAGTWQAWRTVYTAQTILGTVSQAAGVPTGAVIERGTNANGGYVRFADGTQMCWHAATVSLAIDVGHMGGFRTAQQGWTFAAAFAAAPAVSATVSVGTGFAALAHPESASAGAWAVTAVTTQAAADRSVQLLAIGRWF